LQDAEDFSGGVFEDEDTRTFYEVLPDLRFLVPGAAADADGAEAARDGADAPTHDGSAEGAGPAQAEAQDAVVVEADTDASQAAGTGSSSQCVAYSLEAPEPSCARCLDRISRRVAACKLCLRVLCMVLDR
jgi:hypothetical protein